MKKIYVTVAVIGVLFLGFSIALGMQIQEKDGIGKYLTDDEGKTIYWFKKDSPEKSSCSGPCVEKWPIYYRDTVAAPKGLNADDFGTITREDGKKTNNFQGVSSLLLD